MELPFLSFSPRQRAATSLERCHTAEPRGQPSPAPDCSCCAVLLFCSHLRDAHPQQAVQLQEGTAEHPHFALWYFRAQGSCRQGISSSPLKGWSSSAFSQAFPVAVTPADLNSISTAAPFSPSSPVFTNHVNTLMCAEPKAVVSPFGTGLPAMGYISCSTHIAAPHPPFSALRMKAAICARWFSNTSDSQSWVQPRVQQAASSLRELQCSVASVSAHPAQLPRAVQ